MDTVSKEQRHYNMSRIHGKDTKPEIAVRSYLFKNGLRFRKNDKRLPGSPDIVLPKYKTVIFINGCFWHGHEGCKNYHVPKTNTEFWQAKINRNLERDKDNYQQLTNMGWKVIIIWECELKKKTEIEDNLYKLLIEIVGDTALEIRKVSSDKDEALE